MRVTIVLRLIALIAFAIFGGPTPVVATGGQMVICADNAAKRVVAFDFETGKPITAEEALPKCEHCLGGAYLIATSHRTAAPNLVWLRLAFATPSKVDDAKAFAGAEARGPPSRIS